MPVNIKQLFCITLCTILAFVVPSEWAFAGGFQEWESLRDEHVKLHQQGKYEQALVVGKNALALVELEAGKDHLATALSLSRLAETYSSLARYDMALPLQQRALAIREKELGLAHPVTALSLSNLASTYRSLAKYDIALALDQRSLAIREKVLGPDHPDTALSLGNLAVTYSSLAQYENALPLEQRALAIREKIFGPDHPETATSLNNLAETYSNLSQHHIALPLEQRALAIKEKSLGMDHPTVAISLANLASTYSSLAQYDKALPLRQRAVAINEKSLGLSHPATALSLGNLADTYSSLAQYEEALPLQQRALAIYERALGPAHPDTARSLGNLAVTYSKLAQSDKALPLQLRALAIYEKALGPAHPDTARSLGNLAVTYMKLAQFDMALPLQLHALAIYEKALGPAHPDTARSLGNLAVTYMTLAQFDKALPLQLRALAIYEKALGPAHPDTAQSLNNLASTYGEIGEYAKALPILLRALTIYEQTHGSNHPATALVWGNLGYTYLGVGEVDAAVFALKTAANAYQRQREQVARIGTSELRTYTQSIAGLYQKLASLLAEQGRLPEAEQVLAMLKEDEQFDFIRRNASSDPRKTRVGYTAAEEKWVTRYTQIADQLTALGAEEQVLQKAAKLGLTAEQALRQGAVTKDLSVAKQALTAFLAEMRESFASKGNARRVEVFETSEQAAKASKELIKSLGDDVVLLQYFITDDKVNILMTTPGVQLARSSPVRTAALNRQIWQFVGMLRDQKSDVLPAAQELYKLLFEPIAKDLDGAGARTVMLSLDGMLRYLPFGALHDGKEYLAKKLRLPIYTSVVREKLRDPVAVSWRAAGLGTTRKIGEFPALPAVRREMDSIVKSGKAGVVPGVLPGEVYLDEAFSASRLKDVASRRFELMHVASHFQLSPGTEINSFLLLGDGQRLQLSDMRTQNYRFDNVDLLTLSACETGVGGGRDAQGREIEGFGVIAQQQGAKAVLATLWPVADQSTATLMADMYLRRQDKHLTKIEALRQAQVALMNQPKYAHPFYWAPFILMGNWK